MSHLSHTCKHTWPVQMTFSVIFNFLLHCIALYVFWQLTLIDKSKIYLLPFPCHQELSWPTGWMNHVLPIIFPHCIVFFFTLIWYALVSSWLPYRWAIGLNTLISKNACCPEIQNPLAAISARASSVIFAVLSCSDLPVSCWSVGSINTLWHMIFRRLAVRSRIWLWHRLIMPLFLHERTWSMVKWVHIHRLLGVVAIQRSRSRSQKNFLLTV